MKPLSITTVILNSLVLVTHVVGRPVDLLEARALPTPVSVATAKAYLEECEFSSQTGSVH